MMLLFQLREFVAEIKKQWRELVEVHTLFAYTRNLLKANELKYSFVRRFIEHLLGLGLKQQIVAYIAHECIRNETSHEICFGFSDGKRYALNTVAMMAH